MIYVLYLTTGDGYDGAVQNFLHLPTVSSSFIRLGFVRHQEAINAENLLGVPRNHLFFLCFPDTACLKIVKNSNPNKIVRSPKTHLTTAAYPFAYQTNAPYSKASAFRLMREVIERVKPGTIILNRPEDTNPDHRAARNLLLAALQQSKLRSFLLSYLIHFPHWGRKIFLPPLRLQKGTIFQLKLTHQEFARKRRAFELHQSEFLDRFRVHPIEFFWLGANRIT